MGYGFADVEEALSQVHGISDEKRSAFSNRLKHLQRLGFPPGVNTGRGRAAIYYAEHVFMLAVALQLSEFSFTPERTIRVMEHGIARLAGGARAAIANLDEAIFCEVPTGSLQDFVYGDRVSEYGGLGPIDADYANKRLFLMKEVAGPMRWSIFSLSGLIKQLSNLLAGKLRPDGFTDFYVRLDEWASEVGDESEVWRGRDLG